MNERISLCSHHKLCDSFTFRNRTASCFGSTLKSYRSRMVDPFGDKITFFPQFVSYFVFASNYDFEQSKLKNAANRSRKYPSTFLTFLAFFLSCLSNKTTSDDTKNVMLNLYSAPETDQLTMDVCFYHACHTSILPLFMWLIMIMIVNLADILQNDESSVMRKKQFRILRLVMCVMSKVLRR